MMMINGEWMDEWASVFITFGHEIIETHRAISSASCPCLCVLIWIHIISGGQRVLCSHFSGRHERERNGQFRIYFMLDEEKTKKSTNTHAQRAHTHADTDISQIYCMTSSSSSGNAVFAVVRRSHHSCIHIPLVSPIIIIWCRTMSSLFASWLLIRMLPLGIRRRMNAEYGM